MRKRESAQYMNLLRKTFQVNQKEAAYSAVPFFSLPKWICKYHRFHTEVLKKNNIAS